MEQWKQIEGFNYAVSNMGRVKNIRTGRIIKPSMENGTPRVSVYGSGTILEKQKFCISHLVYNYFIKPMRKSVHIGFRDGNKSNCIPDNLYLMSEQPKKYTKKPKNGKTPKESQMDSVLFEGGSGITELDLYCTVRATSYRNYYIRQSPFN